MKKCPKCTRILEDQKFYIKRKPNGTVGVRSYCKECGTKERNNWRKHHAEHDNARNSAYNKRNAIRIRGEKIKNYWPGTTWQQAIVKYNELRINQNGVCAICSRPERRKHIITGAIWDLAIDHCHTTGVVRGLLCNACNRGLGLLGDNIDTLDKVLQYLEKQKEIA